MKEDLEDRNRENVHEIPELQAQKMKVPGDFHAKEKMRRENEKRKPAKRS